MQSDTKNTFSERNTYFLRLAIRLLVAACFLFSLTNFLAGKPLWVVIFNFAFGLIFTLALWLLKKSQTAVVWYLAVFYQSFIFGHAYFLLPGKQIEIGLGLVVVLAPLFFSDRKIAFILVVNIFLYHLAVFRAGYEQFFVGSYIFFFVLMLIMRAIVRENRRYETQLEEQKKIIEQDAATIREVSELKSVFFSNITHELKTPLTLILAPLDNLLSREQLSERNRSLIQLIRKNAMQLLNRVNELLLFSELEVKKVHIKESQVKVRAFFQEVFSLFELKAIQQGLQFKLKNEIDDSVYLLLDAAKLEIIIVNLLSNAIKFTAGGGLVGLEVKRKNAHLYICVYDTGIGVSPEFKETIFERFGRVSHQTYFEGSGIGLALSKELIQLMGGQILLDEGYNEGASFIVTLPWNEIESDSGLPGYELHFDSREVKPVSKGITKKLDIPLIMLVEDNQDLRGFIASLLDSEYQILEAADGKHALKLLEESKPDLVITDLMMPEMGGEELVRRMKSSEKLTSIPVMVLTARSEDADKMNLLRIGVDDYLTKPFQENELLVRSKNLIKNYHLRTAQKSGGGPLGKDSKPDFLEKVETLMQAQLSNPDYAMKNLAEDMAMSLKSLQVKLKSLTGLTPKQYQTALLMHKARQRIKSNKVHSVSNLALEMGYEDAYYFSKAYKKNFGISPKEEFERMKA